METFKFTDNSSNEIEIQVECKVQIESIGTMEDYVNIQTTLAVLMNGEELDKGNFKEFPALTYDPVTKEYSVSPHFVLSGDTATVEKRVTDITSCYAKAICAGASRDMLKKYYSRLLNNTNEEVKKLRTLLAACFEQELAEGYMFTNEDVYKKRLKWKKEHGDCSAMPEIYSENDRDRAQNLLKILVEKQKTLHCVLVWLSREYIRPKEAVIMAGILKETAIKPLPSTNIFDRKAMQ